MLLALAHRDAAAGARAPMHHPHDQRFKALMRVYWELVAHVQLERAVHVPAQRIDLAFQPRARAPELGIVDRMAAQGPGMLEYFANEPSGEDIRACVRKRLNYEHECVLEAQRDGDSVPAEPRLWILTTGRPRAAKSLLRMTGWPRGCWRFRADSHVHLVVLDELPHGVDTLPLRLLGRGSTLQRALAELRDLPSDHVLRTRGEPVLVAFRQMVMQDLERTDDMDALDHAYELYREWQQRTREEEARDILVSQARFRFGELPADASARIAGADHATLLRWLEQVLTAQSVEDVFT
jgi:hypothetical protein